MVIYRKLHRGNFHRMSFNIDGSFIFAIYLCKKGNKFLKRSIVRHFYTFFFFNPLLFPQFCIKIRQSILWFDVNLAFKKLKYIRFSEIYSSDIDTNDIFEQRNYSCVSFAN